MFEFLKNIAYLIGFSVILWAVDRGATLGWFDKTRATIGNTRFTYSQSNWKKLYRWVALVLLVFAAWLLFK